MSALAWSRRHWLFALVAACATALRAVVLLAYQPALIFPDSERYLEYAWRFVNGHWSPDWLRTSGYSLLLIPAVLTRNLVVVAVVQDLLGLATAVLIYAALLAAVLGLAALTARVGDRTQPSGRPAREVPGPRGNQLQPADVADRATA